MRPVYQDKDGNEKQLVALLETYPGVNALFDSPVREDGTQYVVRDRAGSLETPTTALAAAAARK